MNSRQERINSFISKIQAGLSFQDFKSEINEFSDSFDDLQKIYLSAAKKYEELIHTLPPEHKTREICFEAAKINKNARYFIPNPLLKDYDILFELVRNSGDMLKDVPIELRDYKICELALKNHWYGVLKYVPDDLLHHELFQEQIKKVREAIAAENWFLVRELPLSYRDLETCSKAVEKDIEALVDVPESLINNSIFETAIESYQKKIIEDWNLIKKIPQSFLNNILTNEICKKLIDKSSSLAALLLPPKFLNNDVCSYAVTHSAVSIILLQKLIDPKEREFLTAEEYKQLCIAFLKKNPSEIGGIISDIFDHHFMIRLINEGVSIDILKYGTLKDPEEQRLLLTAAVEKDPKAIIYMPNEMRNADLCQKIVSKDGMLIEYVPGGLRNKDLWKQAVTQNGMALEHFFKLNDSSNFSHEESHALCLASVTNKGEAIQFVPTEFKKFDVCIGSVKHSPLSLQYIKKDNSFLSNDDYHKVCLQAVKGDGLAIQHVPIEGRTFDICKSSVESCPDSIKEIVNYKDNSALKDEKEFIKICYFAVGKGGLVLRELPDNIKQNYEICQAAVRQNGLALEFVPKINRDYNLCMLSAKNNGLILRKINHTNYENLTNLNLEQFKEFCLNAVENNPLALQFLDEEMKRYVIDTLTPERLISLNYGVITHFPNDARDKERIDTLIKTAFNIVIHNEPSGKEVRDAYLIYSHSPRRIGVTIRATKEDASKLFDHMKELGNTKDVSLVLLGHANHEAKNIANVDAKEASELLAKYPQINKVILLGCNTVQAQRFESEKIQIRKYHQQNKDLSNDEATCGVVSMLKEPDDRLIEEMLHKIRDNKNSVVGLYIIIKDPKKDEFKLLFIKQNMADDNISRWEIAMNKMQVAAFAKEIGLKNGRLNFPAKVTAPPLYIRWKSKDPNGKMQYLRPAEKNSVENLLQNFKHHFTNKFSKDHPDYKSTKQHFPFLSGVEMEEENNNMLLPSLSKSFVNEIKANPDIKQKVTVKAYNGIVHVDTATREIQVDREYMYTSEYRESTYTFFNDKKENIDKQRLNTAHLKHIASMTKGEEDGTSTVRSVKVNIKPK